MRATDETDFVWNDADLGSEDEQVARHGENDSAQLDVRIRWVRAGSRNSEHRTGKDLEGRGAQPCEVDV